MKIFFALIFFALPIIAKADLTCHGYNKLGQMIPVDVAVYITTQRSGLTSDFNGVQVGAAAGTTSIKAAGNQHALFVSTFLFGDAQTRCEAGATISTVGPELNISLYSWNACSQMPIDHVKADYRGTLTLNEPDGVQNIFLTCSTASSTRQSLSSDEVYPQPLSARTDSESCDGQRLCGPHVCHCLSSTDR